MLRIAYCEDESAQAQQVKSFWKEWSKAREINCQVEIFQNAESFLFAQEPLRRLPYDMLLLDIRMKKKWMDLNWRRILEHLILN